MSKNPGEQQQLQEVDTETNQQTRHEQILKLYTGDSLRDVALGLWGKILVEIGIVSLPLAIVILLPGILLAYFDIGPFTYTIVISAWISFSTTVFGITWCFTEAGISTAEESENEENEAIQE